jgi:hypothetical protein
VNTGEIFSPGRFGAAFISEEAEAFLIQTLRHKLDKAGLNEAV